MLFQRVCGGEMQIQNSPEPGIRQVKLFIYMDR